MNYEIDAPEPGTTRICQLCSNSSRVYSLTRSVDQRVEHIDACTSCIVDALLDGLDPR